MIKGKKKALETKWTHQSYNDTVLMIKLWLIALGSRSWFKTPGSYNVIELMFLQSKQGTACRG